MAPQDQATVVAQATPPGEGGIAVVRLSGPRALSIAARVFRSRGFPDRVESHRAMYGKLIRPLSPETLNSPEGRDVIDHVLALPLLGPRSYTGEDTVEFFCHGGRVVASSVVAACCAAGAVAAGPGEFTRRAFLNGKISLDQAEAVADLIHAGDETAARAAIAQLRGGFDRELDRIERPLLELLSEIEGSLEFAADEDMTVDEQRVVAVLRSACRDTASLLDMAPAGRLLRDGIQVVLTGPPNVGKSSLFNALLEEPRAIVDETPGTTQDVVSARLVRGGRTFVLHDTAGLHASADPVERKGMDRTRDMVNQADIVLHLVSAEEHPPAHPASPGAGPVLNSDDVSPPVVVVITKCDLAESLAEEEESPGSRLVKTSSSSGAGLNELWSVLEGVASGYRIAEAVSLGVVINDRHRAKLSSSLTELTELVRLVEEGNVGQEITASMLAGILAELGEVSGRVFTEHVLAAVFGRFCVGK